jgi:hypothetical protein
MPELEPEARFGRAVAAYDDDPRVELGTGFGGSPGRRVEGRIFAMFVRGELVVKLPAARVSELVAAGVGRPFDAGKGRPMREWVSVPPAEPDRWPGLVAEAHGFVGGLSSRR